MAIKFIRASLGVLLLITLSLGFNGCKKGGGITNTDDPEDPTPTPPPPISSSFDNENTLFSPGEIQFITVENTSLSDEEYNAELSNGTPISLYLNTEDTENKTLVFVVPEVDAGEHDLIFDLEEQEQVLSFEIEEYTVIDNPVEFVTNSTTDIQDRLTILVNETTDDETKQILNQSISDLESALEDYSSLEEEEQKQIAYIIKENFLYESVSMNKSNSMLTSCSTVENQLEDSPRNVAIAATTGAAGGWFSRTLAGKIINSFSISYVLDTLSNTIDRIGYFIENCVAGELSIEKFKSADQAFLFDHNESESFKITLSKTLTGEIEKAVQDLKSALNDFLSLLPESWTNYLFEGGFDLVNPVEAGALSLTISDDMIDGIIEPADSVSSFTFSFLDVNPTESRNFNFQLTDTESNVLEVGGILNPPLPISYNNQFGVRIDSVFTDTLIASYAAKYTFSSQPTNGSVTFLNDSLGVFEYTPNNTVTGGSDSFTFIATNSSGESEIATVTVNLINPFAGTWVMDTFENGTPIGQYVIYEDQTCGIPAGEWTINGETLNIGEQSWSYSGNYTDISYAISIDTETCTVTNDAPNTSEDISYGDSGTYTRNGDEITTTINGESETGSIIFINENKIKLGDLTYVRSQ